MLSSSQGTNVKSRPRELTGDLHQRVVELFAYVYVVTARVCVAGLRVERFMECPACRALSFLGEWQTPKELQSLATATKACEVCKEGISTAYLIQPKEKRVGE